MKFDIVVGNPPYGSDSKGYNRHLHFDIFRNAVMSCSGRMCFIIPSKPIIQQLDEKTLSLFKNAVCTRIETVDTDVFKDTTMDNTAIYYCDRTAAAEDYDRRLDVDDNILDAIEDEGHRIFLSHMRKMRQLSVFRACKMYGRNVTREWFDNEIKNVHESMSDDRFYLFTNRANGSMGGRVISGNLSSAGVMDRDDAARFVRDNKGEKNIIECPDRKYGENLKNLMENGYVLRYSVWLTQTNQHIYNGNYRYVPDVDYSSIDSDEKLLEACGLSGDEICKVMAYLKGFDFSTRRNDLIRNSIK